MREALIGVALVMMALNLVILYAALVVASRCDDIEEEYWRSKKKDERDQISGR